jgi:hypothetical protein
MAAITQGPAFLYGVDGSIARCAVQSVTRKWSFANVNEVLNEQGNRVTKRYDDTSEDITIEMIPWSYYVVPTVGTWLQYSGKKYIIESIDDKREAKGFMRYTLTCTKPEYISDDNARELSPPQPPHLPTDMSGDKAN